jgi:hypothetical protein
MGFFPGGKVCEVTLPFASKTGAKKEWSYKSTALNAFMMWKGTTLFLPSTTHEFSLKENSENY